MIIIISISIISIVSSLTPAQVEYKERVESSDDEFDDLGRRKKKYKLPYKRPMIPSSVPDPESDEEEEDEKKEEEEEEEDDDDGDLSKYDLWGDDDNDKKNDAKEEEKNGTKVAEPKAKEVEKDAKPKAAEVAAKRRSPSPAKAKKTERRRSRSPRFKDS